MSHFVLKFQSFCFLFIFGRNGTILGVKMSQSSRVKRINQVEQKLLTSTTPVDPAIFTEKVTSFLKKHGVLVSEDTPKVIDKLCRLLNYSITNPKLGGLLNRKNILIYPAQTGIGKSVSIQHFAAMLKTESSLIVVNTVEEAREYCQTINKLKAQPNYAQFFSTKKLKDPNQHKDPIANKMRYIQCLVITNKMFKSLHSYSVHPVEEFLYYLPDDAEYSSPRDLVVIDERLSFTSKKKISFNELEGIAKFLEQAHGNSPGFKGDKKLKTYHETLQVILDVITDEQQKHPDHAAVIDQLTIEPHLEARKLPVRINYQGIANAVAARLDEINSEISFLKPSKIANLKEIKNTVVDHLNTLMDIARPLDDPSITFSDSEEVFLPFAVYNKDLYRVKTLYNQFGTAVVLDATAEVNSFFSLSSQSNSQIDVIPAPKIRKYKNLTINLAKGVRQSAAAINQVDTAKAAEVKFYYSSIINEILQDGDKLLVISFKEFIENHLEKEFALNEQVVFTNWGKHVGRNNWSDCNKVLLIGWLRLPEEEYISRLFNISATGTSDFTAMKKISSEAIKELKTSEIADDLVQGAMRCCARIIDTDDSDCKPASIYLFQDELDGSSEVIDLFMHQFPGAALRDWKPKTPKPRGSLTKPNQRKQDVLDSMASKIYEEGVYMRNKLCLDHDLPQATLTAWLKPGNYFSDRMFELGIEFDDSVKKGHKFTSKGTASQNSAKSE